MTAVNGTGKYASVDIAEATFSELVHTIPPDNRTV
jgi:hypothetical protein